MSTLTNFRRVASVTQDICSGVNRGDCSEILEIAGIFSDNTTQTRDVMTDLWNGRRPNWRYFLRNTQWGCVRGQAVSSGAIQVNSAGIWELQYPPSCPPGEKPPAGGWGNWAMNALVAE